MGRKPGDQESKPWAIDSEGRSRSPAKAGTTHAEPPVEWLARLITVSGAARAVADAMLATLPEATRAKYPTAESLVVLYAEDTIKDVAAVQITTEKYADPQHVTLMLRTANPHESEVPMLLGPNGWQIDLSQGKLFEKIKSQLLKPRR